MNATRITIYRRPIVRQLTGYSDSSIDRMEAMGLFPARVKLNPYGRAVGWQSDAVDQWLENRPVVDIKRSDVRDVTKIGQGLAGPGRPKKSPAQAA